MNSCIRESRVLSKPSSPSPPPPIRWRKGELIGSGAFGRVYMGMNLDSGELLAVKEVLIAANSASKEKAQARVKELEEEVKLLKNLSHPNIVRYLGTAIEEETLNILLEFVPGGSISSLLGKFRPFPEAVIRTYTKQLLLGLKYLHNNGIVHRDIKGANSLVDNKGIIKLADFGASKQVVELATDSGVKSMRGTSYWMAPEVIMQTGHSFSADIWSVGCTVIEMVTGKPPWSQLFKEEIVVRIKCQLIPQASELKKLQTPLYEECNDLNLSCSASFVENKHDETPPRSPGSNNIRHVSNIGNASDQIPLDNSSTQHSDYKGLLVDGQPESCSPSEKESRWKEELDLELERKREMMRQAGVGGKTSSPKDQAFNRQRDRTRFASPGK
ncbi:hypothetical protein PTKIN_Ptkin01aG0320800 [Pterospermum kingtungense]